MPSQAPDSKVTLAPSVRAGSDASKKRIDTYTGGKILCPGPLLDRGEPHRRTSIVGVLVRLSRHYLFC